MNAPRLSAVPPLRESMTSALNRARVNGYVAGSRVTQAQLERARDEGFGVGALVGGCIVFVLTLVAVYYIGGMA